MTGSASVLSSSATEVLQWAIATYGPRFGVLTSFQMEGMVVIDMALRFSGDVRVITLDTGRLPEETHTIIDAVRRRYGVPVEVVIPDRAEVEQMVLRHGVNLFRESPAHRSLCCEIRKVRPLQRKLAELDAWATGLRSAQTASRAAAQRMELVGDKTKINPLVDWTREQVEAYTIEHDLPRHPLYAQGYSSIGCAPCTRATTPGEDERAGRWWWEQGSAKECGLHFRPDGTAERTLDVLVREVVNPRAS